MEVDTYYADEPVRDLEKAVRRRRQAEGALGNLLDIYEKKVAKLEEMRRQGILRPGAGEWSLQRAIDTLGDIRKAIRASGSAVLKVRVGEV